MSHTQRVQARGHVYRVAMLDNAAALTDSLRDEVRGSVFVLTDHNVEALYLTPLMQSLGALGCRASAHSVAPGERAKTLEGAGLLYSAMATAHLGRDATLLCLGGGVVSDLGGFVASTYMRGTRLLHLPTTTLAALDSTVGGKCGLNHGGAKNLVGSFYAPHGVVCVLPWLRTQDVAQHAGGLVEAVKVACTHDAALLTSLQRDAAALLNFETEALAQVLKRSIAIKADVVQRDEFEAGERVLLNFGHTVGHALEKGCDYRLSHGEAVAVGMLVESAWACAQGWSEAAVTRQIKAALSALKVPLYLANATMDDTALRLDKKRQGDSVRLPVVPAIGRSVVRDAPVQALSQFARDFLWGWECEAGR